MTSKFRYLISAAVLVACVCLALAVVANLPPRPGVTKANFDRIEVGMTYAEVTAIFGNSGYAFDDGIAIRIFADDRSIACVDFADDSVTSKAWHSSPESIPDKLRRWLNLPK